MECLAALPLHVVLVILIFLHSLEGALANVTPSLNPGFEFDYDKPNQPLSIPVTSQCERIHLEWSRTSNDTGLSPVAPYFLQVYSSTSSTPYVVEAGFGPTFDWDVPFAPNTQYQICMFDINGVSGGCQATYSVIANTTTNNPSCQNVTAPNALSVSATVPNGAMFQYSYIDQCETLSVTPRSGSPPFILTVAPNSHPPYNITANTMGPISWQVSLPIGFNFFLSLESADGLKWANGPMKVGGLGTNACLVPGTISQNASEKIVIGATVGGTFFGIAVGILGCLIFFKLQHRRRPPSKLYFGRDSFSRDSPTRPLKAPSSLMPSSSVPSSPTVASMPLTSTSALRVSEDQGLPLDPVPLRRPPRSHRSVEPYTAFPSEAGSTQTQYPADVKRPLPASDVLRDDAASLASSSSNSRSNPRPLSTHSRAPTYVPRSQLRGAVHAVNETAVPEMPPEYGRHTADPSLNYAPSILSSGNRF
ncbi:hypothetical protein BDZ97DRAFT_1838645 [Flammula alnicola]|nr:hypothetical protein BDZ97DRAFT_1838645 [Flammula alnicola]